MRMLHCVVDRRGDARRVAAVLLTVVKGVRSETETPESQNQATETPTANLPTPSSTPESKESKENKEAGEDFAAGRPTSSLPLVTQS